MSLRAPAKEAATLERGAAERGGPVGLRTTGGEAKRSPLNGAPSRREQAVQQ